MPGKRPGQMLVAAVLMIGLFLMSLLVTAYQAHALFLRARSVVARETVGAITADFNRALATMLALATRSYYDSTRYSDFITRFVTTFGLRPHDLESAKQVANQYLDTWINVQRVVYAEYGIQILWQPYISDVSSLLIRPAYVFDLILIDWNKTISGSYICAQLQLNLTNAGFYHWISRSIIGLTLAIEGVDISKNEVNITVLRDSGTYYGLLLAKGRIEIYLFDGVSWKNVSIKDVTYKGLGRYRLTLNEALKDYEKILIFVSDERGIIVLAQTELSKKRPSSKKSN